MYIPLPGRLIRNGLLHNTDGYNYYSRFGDTRI